MNKLDIKKKQKEDSLLNTAFDLFINKGIAKTSISDIVSSAGVAKGTFYLYFKDKYDIRNKLIAHKSSEVFTKAYVSLENNWNEDFTERVIFIANHIIDQFNKDKVLLNFISKNLSWGIFKNALTATGNGTDVDFKALYEKIVFHENVRFSDPELMIYMIIELVSSTCYSSILYSEPVSIDELKPPLFCSIRGIIENFKIEEKS